MTDKAGYACGGGWGCGGKHASTTGAFQRILTRTGVSTDNGLGCRAVKPRSARTGRKEGGRAIPPPILRLPKGGDDAVT